MEELGLIENDGDGGGGAGDFDNKAHAWAVWNEGEMEDDDEKMKSAALFIMSKHGSPSEFAANKGQIKTILKGLLGYGLRTCEFALITYDAPYVQDALVPYLLRQAETKTIVLAGPSATQKSAFAKALFGEYHLVTSVDALKLCSFRKCRNIIADDFDFTTLKDGSVESLKQLFLVDVNSEDVVSINARYSPAEVPVNVRRMFTTNCLDLASFLKIHVPPEHWDAIASRVEWVLLSDVRGSARYSGPHESRPTDGARCTCRLHRILPQCAHRRGPVLDDGASGHRQPAPERASA